MGARSFGSGRAPPVDRSGCGPHPVQLRLFALPNLSRMVAELHRSGRAVVVTLHATHEPVIDSELIRLADIAQTLRKIDRIIVHQQLDADRLAVIGVVAVEVVPHGATVGRLPARAVIRNALGLGDRPVVSTFGFALPHKGLIRLITAIRAFGSATPTWCSWLASACRGPIVGPYFERCRREVSRLGLQDECD